VKFVVFSLPHFSVGEGEGEGEGDRYISSYRRAIWCAIALKSIEAKIDAQTSA